MTRLFRRRRHGSRHESFGRKKRRSNKPVNIFVISILLISTMAAVYLLTLASSTDPESTSELPTAAGELESIDAFEKTKDEGSVDELNALLSRLKTRRIESDNLPVKLDNLQKTILIADRIIDHPDRAMEDYNEAMQVKLDATWQTYILNLKNQLEDPFVVDQFFATAQTFADNDDPEIAKVGLIAQSKGMALTLTRADSPQSITKIGPVVMRLIREFPDDPVVEENVRMVLSKVGANQSEYAAELSGEIASLAEQSGNAATARLARFMMDIVLLFQAGIGNFPSIANITVDPDDFMQRMTRLNDDLAVGPTVIKQLDNGIDFFERRRRYDLARVLSQQIVDKALKRDDPECVRLAESIGKRGLTRNQIIGKEWNFSTSGPPAGEITADDYLGKVVAIFFYSENDPRSMKYLELIYNLQRILYGQPVEYIGIAIEAPNESKEPTRRLAEAYPWAVVKSSFDSPNEYLQQCPVRRFPYMILIDRDGFVDSINVEPGNLKTRIEFLLSKP